MVGGPGQEGVALPFGRWGGRTSGVLEPASMEKCTLYHADSSYYSMIARLGFAEKGASYESRLLDIHAQTEQLEPWYARIQPAMTVPALVCGDERVGSSREILEFVDARFPGPALVPPDRAPMDAWLDRHYGFEIENLTIGKLASTNPLFRTFFLGSLRKLVGVCRDRAREHPDLAEAYEHKAQQDERRLETFGGSGVYEESLRLARGHLDALEEQLRGGPWIAGEVYSLADVVWTNFLARLCFVRKEDEIRSRPAVHEYWERVRSRPSFAQADVWTSLRPGKILHMLWEKFLHPH